MTVDFDELSRQANGANAERTDLESLFKATFELPEWLFIARGEPPNYNPYIAMKQGVADGQQMVRAFTDSTRLHRFGKENGLLEANGTTTMLSIPTSSVIEYLEPLEKLGVHGVWFNSDLESDGYLVPLKQLRVIKNHLDDKLANFGLSKTADGLFDVNLVVNKIGTLSFESSIVPFYEALGEALKEYEGAGDFVTLLAFDPAGVTHLTENVLQNAHGPYLRSRNFQYLNPKNGVNITVGSLHTNRMRHTGTNAELTVSVELCKNLDDRTAVLYHRFAGPRAEVLRLSGSFGTILSGFNYDPVN